MPTIKNPVLPGFNPDPSFVRVGDDYYIVTSTFEWFPGVPIYHSRDLVNWRRIGHILTRQSQFDLRGVPDSCGVWAPSLSYRDGQFWLVYTNVRNSTLGSIAPGRPFKDIKIFLTTATDILGPWSDPIELDSIGFDPSLFHDDDGRKWLVNMVWDFRKGHYRFAGIVAQEYDHAARKLIGPRHQLLTKQRNVLTEGPNIYKRAGWYYLMLAEGGTGWNHGISMARSRSITGPYELDPQQSVITSRDNYALALQRAGHGEIVETPNGEWYLAHLAARPVGTERRCPLGRETCLQRVTWSGDGWLRLAHGGHSPAVEVPAPKDAGLSGTSSQPVIQARDDFSAGKLDTSWSALRVPMDESWLSLRERAGWLRLRGRESPHSLFEQSLVAKRMTSLRCVAETCMEFSPSHWAQMAGLVCMYNSRQFYYLRATFDEKLGRVLGIVLTDGGVYDELTDSQIQIGDWNSGKIFLRAEVDRDALRFSASPDGREWRQIGPRLDASKLSDEYAQGFTGTMIGLCAQDLSGDKTHADFDYFELRET
jgi:xylan 1,4-beta-xylosidase